MLPCRVFLVANEVTKHGAFHAEAGAQQQVLRKWCEAPLCLLGNHCAFPPPRQMGLLSHGSDDLKAWDHLGGIQKKGDKTSAERIIFKKKVRFMTLI